MLFQTDVVQEATGLFTPEKLSSYAQAAMPTLLNVVVALLILWVGSKVARWISNLIKKNIVKAPNIDETLANFVSSIVRYAILAMVFIAAIGKLGVQTASLVAIMGAATLAIGMALQGTLSNLAAGVMLMLFRPFKLGDYVSVAGQEGVVTDMNIFTTELSTVDNVQVIIANGEAWGSTIQNFTSKDKRRVDVTFGIDYNDDIDKAIEIIKSTASANSSVINDPHGPWAKVVNLGDSSVDIQMRVWTTPADYWDVKFDLTKDVKEAFDKGGISIPYPHSVEIKK